MQKILLRIQDETLRATIQDVLSQFEEVEIQHCDQLDRESVLSNEPILIIFEYPDAEALGFFKAAIEDEVASQIPFMFVVPESEKWSEIEGFRLGYDTKVSKERPKLGVQLRVQAILKKGSGAEDITAGKVRDLQALMQSIITKRLRSEDIANTGTYAAIKVSARPKILIAEDEPMTRSVLETALERNYDLVFAADGKKGLEEAIKEEPDLIISDMMMPVMDGMEFLKRLRETAGIARTPFLFLTARGAVEDKIAGLEHGADEYLSKPFSVRELQLRVERLVEESRLRRGAAGVLQGQLSEVTLPDVLQIIANNQKTGELVIETADKRNMAKVFFKDGQVVHATFGKFKGLKAFFRMLSLEQGSFLFENRKLAVEPTINERLENLLLEGYRQLDELEMLRLRFADGFKTVLKPGSEKAVQTGLSTNDALVLFAVSKTATISEVMNQVAQPDLEVLESIINLLESKLLTTE